jgi:hypothetical protein
MSGDDGAGVARSSCIDRSDGVAVPCTRAQNRATISNQPAATKRQQKEVE